MLRCGAGYRAPYIVETARMLTGGYDFMPLYAMDLDEARKGLTEFKGVGIKVADCVVITSYSIHYTRLYDM